MFTIDGRSQRTNISQYYKISGKFFFLRENCLKNLATKFQSFFFFYTDGKITPNIKEKYILTFFLVTDISVVFGGISYELSHCNAFIS